MIAAVLALALQLTPAPPELIVAGNVHVQHWPEQRRLAQRIAEVSMAVRLPALPAGVLDEGPAVHIVLAPDEGRFAALTGGRVPHWGAGVAFPDQGLIVIPAHRAAVGTPDELARVVIHELAHVALQRYLAPARIPRWFSEGYAVWSAGQLDFEAGWLLRVAFLTGRAPPLDSLELGWPRGGGDARVAYLLSASVIQFLHDRGGEFALRRFLERWAAGQSMEQALFQTYGLTPDLLERDWSRDVRRRYGWTVFFAQGVVIWMIVALIVLFFYVIRRRRNRRKLDKLLAEELPDAPAFWVEGYQGEDALDVVDPSRAEGEARPRRADDAAPRATDDGERNGEVERS